MRRNAGEGTVTLRRDGRWQVALQVDGVRKIAYGKTEKEARRKLLELQGQVSTLGALPDAGRRTVNDLLDAWLETGAPTWKPTTAKTWREQCERHIRPALGKVKLTRLRPDHLQRLYAKYSDRPATAERLHVILHRALALAVLWRWLPENIADRVLRPAYRAGKKEVWTPAELSAFLAGAVNHWLYPLWLTAIASGARIGELTALRWEDVNLADGTLTIGRNLQRIGGEYVVGEPKTEAGRRTISLPADVMHVLKRHKVKQAEARLRAGGEWANLGLVFTGELGRPLHRSVPNHALGRECQRLGIPVMTSHGLRHLSASLLLEKGLPIPQVSKRLGHASPAITMQVYAHVVKRDDSDLADAIGRALAGR